MAKLYIDTDKYGDEHASPVVEAFHSAIKDMVRQRLDEHNLSWNDFVFGKSYELITADDMAAVESQLLAAGHRFDWSAAISPRERPEAYKASVGTSDEDLKTFSFEHPEAPTSEADADGRAQCGVGDNVAKYPQNISGTARYVRSSDRVLKWLSDGVPDNTIAVIDDSGGTLTAPVLEQFKGVICAGGTVRSHLGILTREYGIPCFMNARVSRILEGDKIEMECSAAAKPAEFYQQGKEQTARVWRHSRG